MEKRSYFKRTFKFALLWPPSKRIFCFPFSHINGKPCRDMSLKKAQAILADCQNSCCPPPSHGRPHCCVQVCEVQTRCLSNTRVILANSPSSTEMQHGEPREWGVNSGSSPGGHLHRCGAAPFPGQAGAPPTQHPRLPCPEPCLAPCPAQEPHGGNQSTYPFDEETLLQHSSFFLHRGQGTEQSPRRELPAPWQPVPLHRICLRKLIFLCSPPPVWRTLPPLGFFLPPSLPVRH